MTSPKQRSRYGHFVKKNLLIGGDTRLIRHNADNNVVSIRFVALNAVVRRNRHDHSSDGLKVCRHDFQSLYLSRDCRIDKCEFVSATLYVCVCLSVYRIISIRTRTNSLDDEKSSRCIDANGVWPVRLGLLFSLAEISHAFVGVSVVVRRSWLLAALSRSRLKEIIVFVSAWFLSDMASNVVGYCSHSRKTLCPKMVSCIVVQSGQIKVGRRGSVIRLGACTSGRRCRTRAAARPGCCQRWATSHVRAVLWPSVVTSAALLRIVVGRRQRVPVAVVVRGVCETR